MNKTDDVLIIIFLLRYFVKALSITAWFFGIFFCPANHVSLDFMLTLLSSIVFLMMLSRSASRSLIPIKPVNVLQMFSANLASSRDSSFSNSFSIN